LEGWQEGSYPLPGGYQQIRANHRIGAD